VYNGATDIEEDDPENEVDLLREDIRGRMDINRRPAEICQAMSSWLRDARSEHLLRRDLAQLVKDTWVLDTAGTAQAAEHHDAALRLFRDLHPDDYDDMPWDQDEAEHGHGANYGPGAHYGYGAQYDSAHHEIDYQGRYMAEQRAMYGSAHYETDHQAEFMAEQGAKYGGTDQAEDESEDEAEDQAEDQAESQDKAEPEPPAPPS
jgi:hypothetical protein